MAHSGASSVVSQQQPVAKKAERPKQDDMHTFSGADGEPAFTVRFKEKNTVEIKRVGEPDVFRTIVPKYGNIRKVDGQMKQAAEEILWYLFNLTDSN